MRRLRKFALWSLALGLLLGLLGLLVLNLYLNSQGARERISGALRKRLGVPIEMGRISYIPFQGLKIADPKLEQREDLRKLGVEPFFRAESIVAEIDLMSVIRRPVRCRALILNKPMLALPREGTTGVALPWRSPRAGPPQPLIVAQPPTPEDPTSGDLLAMNPAASPGDTSPGLAVETPSPPTPPAPTPAPSPVPSQPTPIPPPPAPARSVLVDEIRCRGGGLRLLSSTGAGPLLEMREIQGEMKTSGEAASPGAEIPLGHFEMAALDVPNIGRMDRIRSRISFQKGALLLPDLSGLWEGGKVEGVLALNSAQPGNPFQIRLKGRGVQLGPAVKRAMDRPEFSSGEAQFDLAAIGLLAQPQSWRGAVIGEVAEARLANTSLDFLGQVKGGPDYYFETARAKMAILGPQIQIQDLHLKTRGVELKCLGALSFSREVNLAVRLYFSENYKTLFERVEQSLGDGQPRQYEQLEGRDDYFRDFRVMGRLPSAQTNIFGPFLSLEETGKLVRQAASR